MQTPFLTKKYWLRLTPQFLFLLLVYSIINYAFQEMDKPYWSLSEIVERIGTAYFMAVFFTPRRVSHPKSFSTETEMQKIKWSLKDFMAAFGCLLLLSILIMSVWFGIALLISHYAVETNEPVGKAFLTTIAFTSVMSLLIVLLMMAADRIGVRWNMPS